jgi:hypothetical protein
MARACEEILAQGDPLSPEARFCVARREALKKPAGVLDMARALSRGPYLLSMWMRNEFTMNTASRSSSLVRGRSLLAIVEHLPMKDGLDAELLRALALEGAVEYEGRDDLAPRALSHLNALLDRWPEAAPAWVLRASLHLHAGRLLRAARDLRVAREALGAEGCLLFYEGVLRAARGEPAAAVRERLEQAARADYEVWGEERWTPELYPPLLRYRGLPGFELIEPH